jgi:hypothetical protein
LTWLAKIVLVIRGGRSIIPKGEIMARIVRGQVVGLFAFDAWYEAPLERLSVMLATTLVQSLSRKKQTPAYMRLSAPLNDFQLRVWDNLPNCPTITRQSRLNVGTRDCKPI